MLGLPRKTEMNRRITKTTIYDKFQFEDKQEKMFDADISRVYMVNEISEYSVGVEKGEDVVTIHILRVVMKTKEYNDSNILKLFKLIGNKIILALQYEDEVQVVAYHTKLFKTRWQPEDEVKLSLSGLTLDTMYVNLVTQIGSFKIQEGYTLDQQIAANEQKAKLEKEIARLEKLARAEKQPKKKFELVEKIKGLKGGFFSVEA